MEGEQQEKSRSGDCEGEQREPKVEKRAPQRISKVEMRKILGTPIYKPEAGALCTVAGKTYVYDPAEDKKTQQSEECPEAQIKAPQKTSVEVKSEEGDTSKLEARRDGQQSDIDTESDASSVDTDYSLASEEWRACLLKTEQELQRSNGSNPGDKTGMTGLAEDSLRGMSNMRDNDKERNEKAGLEEAKRWWESIT